MHIILKFVYIPPQKKELVHISLNLDLNIYLHTPGEFGLALLSEPSIVGHTIRYTRTSGRIGRKSAYSSTRPGAK